MPTGPASHSRLLTAISVFLVVTAAARIIYSYSYTAQAFDEPCHVAAGMEFLDRDTYTLDPVHPTLARIAIALPLYLAGERYPILSASDPTASNYNVVGNHILYDSGHFLRNLILARVGVLPFFALGALIVYRWTRHLAGVFAGTIAVFIYTTTPSILAFSGIAYTDIVACSTQLAAMFAVALWLERPDWQRTIWLGVAFGFAFLAKMTSFLFIPAAVAAMTILWWIGERNSSWDRRLPLKKLAATVAIAALLVWGGYRFWIHPLHEATGITAASMPSFQHFPAPLRDAARKLVLNDPRLPAPELLHGFALAYALNKSDSQSYLFGRLEPGGRWYFYLVALAVKLPLPLLGAFLISGIFLVKRRAETKIWLPVTALLVVFLLTANVKYQVGSRHVLVAVPLLIIFTATGLGHTLQKVQWRSVTFLALAALLTWQLAESARSQSDFLAYFNQLAGSDPSSILVTGCDLDCGQDLFRLTAELRSRHISQCALAIWSSADTGRSGLPQNQEPGSHQGCIALSARAFRLGDVLHQSYGPDYFAWLAGYQPTALVGQTIRLYDIPVAPNSENSPDGSK